MTHRYSYNELRALLHKAFRGLGLVHAAEAAECVLWLEAHGLRGMVELQKHWTRLERSPTAIVALPESTPAHATVNAADACALTVGASCFDLAVAHAHISKQAQVHVKDCFARLFALPYCQRVMYRLSVSSDHSAMAATSQHGARSGMHVLCYWHSDGHTHLISARPSNAFPSYLIMTNDKQPNEQNLTIICSQSADIMDAQLSAWSGQLNNALSVSYGPEDFADHHQTTLLQGLEVESSDYARLQEAASRMLVPASEQSRRGAGD